MEEFNLEEPRQEHAQLGSLENPIIDSNMSREEALRPNPELEIPEEIFERQALVTVRYLSFDGKHHQGQIVVDKRLQQDVEDFFEFLVEQKFQVNKVVPVAHKDYNFGDVESMEGDNSSGFNPRVIAGTKRLSTHGMGWAIDINPVQNPYLGKDGFVIPENPVPNPDLGEGDEKDGKLPRYSVLYSLDEPGTITPWIAEFLIERGWNWGLKWYKEKGRPVDIHHFDKKLGEMHELG